MNNEIIERLERIETKLDNIIKAIHDYDNNGGEDDDDEQYVGEDNNNTQE